MEVALIPKDDTEDHLRRSRPIPVANRHSIYLITKRCSPAAVAALRASGLTDGEVESAKEIAKYLLTLVHANPCTDAGFQLYDATGDVIDALGKRPDRTSILWEVMAFVKLRAGQLSWQMHCRRERDRDYAALSEERQPPRHLTAREMISDAIDQLRERYANDNRLLILRLRIIDRLTCQEIGVRLEMPLSTVYDHYNKQSKLFEILVRR